MDRNKIMATTFKITLTDGTNSVNTTMDADTNLKEYILDLTDLSSIENKLVDIKLEATGDAGEVGERVYMFFASNDHIYSDRKNAFIEFPASSAKDPAEYQEIETIKAHKYAEATSFKASLTYKTA